jgi:hypothetical protein
MTLGPRVINDNWQFAQRLCSFGSLGMIVNGLQKSSCVTRVCGAAARGGRSWTGGMFDHPKVSPSQPNNIVNKSLHKISSEAPAMVNMAEQETNRKKQSINLQDGGKKAESRSYPDSNRGCRNVLMEDQNPE